MLMLTARPTLYEAADCMPPAAQLGAAEAAVVRYADWVGLIGAF